VGGVNAVRALLFITATVIASKAKQSSSNDRYIWIASLRSQ
jgi:hypothetical protein